MRQVDMREADTILASFPGPVTLYVGRRRKFLGLALSLGFAAFCALLLVSDFHPQYRRYDTVMEWVGLVFFGACAIRAAILLLVPSAACLTLDADGFEISSIFWHVRLSWRDVRGFRVEKSRAHGNASMVMYEVLTAGAPKITKALPNNYGLPKNDLAWLMEQWRQRALTQQVVRMH